ncbi:MAG: peptidoglycan DD-metalloendopeptidase family protein [Bacteroidales bacterium]|jgi:septal ring factor EnvC (AmiA/AmiB activator)|nr:peptidoglycan DD-metalloendopeptidase family protein [Bacteroidales bacterium]
MRNRLFKRTFTVLAIILAFNNVFSQTKEEFKQKQLKTQESLEITNQLLFQTEKSKSAGLNKLLIIKKRIGLRERLITEIVEEINSLEEEISKNKIYITKLEYDLKELKEEYARMIYYAYKNRNNFDRVMFILAAEDFNQAYRRMRYFKEYTKYRKKQAERIIVKQKNLEYETEQLQDKKNDKIRLLSNKEREKSYLTIEQNKENVEINRLKRKESELRKQIRSNEKIMRQLKKAIDDLIAKDAKGNSTFKLLSASEEIISQGFISAKGKHSWPVEDGIIIQEFGRHPHPVIKGVMTNNEGVDIGAAKDSKVKTIFEGEVKMVFAVPGANMAVIVRHGHYLTLYSNIVNVRVKPGDKIVSGFYIGDVYFSENNKGSILHLGIYEETKVLNPKNWLSKQ